jgi:hypothetical protein
LNFREVLCFPSYLLLGLAAVYYFEILSFCVSLL